jgi:hypothetical protein
MAREKIMPKPDTEPKILYHGTRTAIHATDEPFLDPQRSIRDDGTIKKDACDPDVPHVYLTDSKINARLFALHTEAKQHACGCHEDGKFPVAIYETKPVFHGEGYVYRFEKGNGVDWSLTQGDASRLHIDWRDEGKYAIYERLPVSAAPREKVTLRSLMSDDEPVRIFYFDEKTDRPAFDKANAAAARQGIDAHVAFLSHEVEAGRLHYVDLGIKNDPWLAATPKEQARKNLRRYSKS